MPSKTKIKSRTGKKYIKSVPKSMSPFKSKKAIVVAILFATIGLAFVSSSFAGSLPAPALILPDKGSQVKTPKPAFSWTQVQGADEYAIQVARADDPNFTKPVMWKKSSTTTFVSPRILGNGRYIWRVRSRSLNFPGPWSRYSNFAVLVPGTNPGGGTNPTPTPTATPIPTPTPTPSLGYVKAFDRANDIKDPAWFKKMYDQGFRLYVLHTTWWEDTTPNMTPKCIPWPGAKQHIKWALDAGIKVGAYTRDPRCWKGGIEAAGEYQNQLQFFDIDIEDDPGVKVTREMIDGIKAMGVRPIIYSGYGMWENVMGKNNNQFSDVPLWDTNVKWEGRDKWEDIKKVWVPNILDPKPILYGGWNTPTNMRVAIQQSFDTVVEGEAVDVNTFQASFLK